jgi:PAS domain-containing protein
VPQREVELILVRQLASYLTLPMFVVDPKGTLIFFNEPAEALLGRRFDETGELTVEEWSSAFALSDDQGAPLLVDELPLVSALRDRRPAHGTFWVRGAEGELQAIEVTAFPMVGQAGRDLGAVGLFWSEST